MESPVIPTEDQAEPVQLRPSRPSSVTILVLGVLIITALNLTRLVLGIKHWDFLLAWRGVSPLYIVFTGLIWSLAGLPLLWGLWRGNAWAPRLMQAEALTYALYYWLDQVFLVDHPVSGAEGTINALLPVNWPFAAGVTVISLAFIAWTLKRKKVKAYFDVLDTHEKYSDADDDEDDELSL